MMTRDSGVASSQIAFVSSSSTKNVDLFSRMRSLAPSRVKTRSTTVNLQDSAATKHPIYAIIAARQVWRRSVDFPPMLGPVINSVCGSPRVRSFGINFFFAESFMTIWTHGWRICFNSSTFTPDVDAGSTSGLHIGPSESSALTSAKVHRQSSSPMHETALLKIALCS